MLNDNSSSNNKKNLEKSLTRLFDIYKDISHHSFSIINKFFLSSNITKVINNSKIIKNYFNMVMFFWEMW